MKSRRSGHPRRGMLAGSHHVAALAFVACLLMLTGCGSAGPTWQALGTSQSNTILSLTQDPTQPKIMYAGATHGIIYRSRTDINGTPLGGSGLPGSDQANAVLPDPHTAGLVYAATTSGLYVSTDFGDHWTRRGAGLPANEALTSLAFAGDGTLRAGTVQHGVYASADRGQTWHQLSTGLPPGSDVYTLFLDPTTRTLFAGLDGDGLYASGDNGQSWSQQSSGMPASAHVYALAMTPSRGLSSSGPTLYSGADSGLYASVDGGHTWTRQDIGIGLPSGAVRALAADPTAPGILYAGIATNVYGSTDGGRRWSVVAPGLSQAVTSLLVVVQPNGKTAVFAGSGQLQRFPAAPGGNSAFSSIVNWLFIAMLIGLGYLTLRRMGRQPIRIGTRGQAPGSAAANGTPSSPAASTEPTEPPAANGARAADRTRANGYIPPRPPAPRSAPPARQDGPSANKPPRPRNRNGGGQPHPD